MFYLSRKKYYILHCIYQYCGPGLYFSCKKYSIIVVDIETCYYYNCFSTVKTLGMYKTDQNVTKFVEEYRFAILESHA